MAHQPLAPFDSVAAAFADYGTTVRGYVRYYLVQHNLAPYLPKQKAKTIVDIGGGSGADTAWLAERGHRVVYIEPSKVQRRFAERRFNFLLEDDIRERITLGGQTLADLPVGEQYDLVLMHTVAQYQKDPTAFIKSVLPYVKPGGTISILERSYYGAEERLIRTRRYKELPRLRRSGVLIGYLKQKVYCFKPEEIEHILREAGFKVIEWSGVRVLSDAMAMPASSLPAPQLKTLLNAEVNQGHHPAIRGHGQLLHFIAQRDKISLHQ